MNKDRHVGGQGRRAFSVEPLEGRTLMSGGGVLEFGGAEVRGGNTPMAGVPYAALSAILVTPDGSSIAWGYDGVVSVSLAGTNPGTLTGAATDTANAPVTARARDSVAWFGDVTFSAPGDYHLVATDDRGDVATETVSVLPTAARWSVQVVSGPTPDPATGTFDLTVGVFDALGTLAPNDAADPAVGSVSAATIVINTGPFDKGPLLVDAAGRTTVTATVNPDGTQTFAGLRVTAYGLYTFSVYDVYDPVAGRMLPGLLTTAVDLPATPAPRPADPPRPAPTPPTTGGSDAAGGPADPATQVSPTADRSSETAATPVVVGLTKKEARAAAAAAAKATRAARRAARATAAAHARAARLATLVARRAAHATLVAARRAAADPVG